MGANQSFINQSIINQSIIDEVIERSTYFIEERVAQIPMNYQVISIIYVLLW
jgi:hypothetical protein